MILRLNVKGMWGGVPGQGRAPGFDNRVKQPSLFTGSLLREVCFFKICIVILQDMKGRNKNAAFLK